MENGVLGLRSLSAFTYAPTHSFVQLRIRGNYFSPGPVKKRKESDTVPSLESSWPLVRDRYISLQNGQLLKTRSGQSREQLILLRGVVREGFPITVTIAIFFSLSFKI